MNKPGEYDRQRRKQGGAPLASSSPPIHENIAGARKNLGNIVPGFNEPRCLGDDLGDKKSAPEDDGCIVIDDLGNHPGTGRRAIPGDPCEIDPEKAFGSEDQDVLLKRMTSSDRLPPAQSPASNPPPELPKKKPTSRTKRKPITRRVKQDNPSLLEKAGSAISRAWNKINPFKS